MNIILLSGGIDSMVVASLAPEPKRALFIEYGQDQQSVEHTRAYEIAESMHLDIDTIGVRLPMAKNTPEVRTLEEIREGGDSPWIIPNRNATMLSIAAAYCRGGKVWIGATAADAEGFPDCRPIFFESLELTLKLAGVPVEIRHPLTHMTKGRVIREAGERNLPLRLAWSCYTPVQSKGYFVHCGRCDACIVRRAGFEDSPEKDPTEYAVEL